MNAPKESYRIQQTPMESHRIQMDTAGGLAKPMDSKRSQRNHMNARVEIAAIQVLEYLGFPRISRIFLIITGRVTKIIEGNWGPRRS